MKNQILNLITEAMNDKAKFRELENIYTLYDQLQYSANINEMAQNFSEWLYIRYNAVGINFSLFDMKNETTELIVKNGIEFFPDGPLSFYFIVNTHTDINAVISFCVRDQEQHDLITSNKNFLDFAFFQTSPILQNGIMKKQHIESSSIDSVTNVHNRQYLIERIQKIVSLSKSKDEKISFLMIGVDRFKAVIEEFDYDIGDQVLIELAQVIYSVIREFDIVARLTGDEFLVALLNLNSKEMAEEIALKIVQKFANTKIIVNAALNQILQKTICVGISTFPEDSRDINQVLKNADNFLNEAKNKGRSEVAIYTEEDNSSIDLF